MQHHNATITTSRNIQLNLALKEAVLDVRELSIFFAGLTGIHTFFNLSYARNKCLKQGDFVQRESHVDNEGSIKPDSSIFTVSLGSSGKILFSNLISEGEQELTVEPKSLYEMTRQSQNFYKHQVLPNESNTVRYSITLRCVHWTNFNSTYYAVGDSNFGGIEFGSGRGKVGKAWAACVKDIVPTKCASYRNVVIMCGTNDLKNNKNDVLGTYKVLKGKFDQIRSVNEHGNIFVCPVLPSRDLAINQRINEFNRYLFHDLQQSNLGVNFIHGFNEFAAHGVLKDTLHDKKTPKDVLHINVRGYSILVRLIKQAIFSVKKVRKRQKQADCTTVLSCCQTYIVMSSLKKEKCVSCEKFINIAQCITECAKCLNVIHSRCFSKSNFKQANEKYYCEICQSLINIVTI